MSKPKTFGAHLRAVRGERPRVDIAAAAGIHPQQLVKLELGKTEDPRLSTVVRLARALKVDVAALIAPVLPKEHAAKRSRRRWIRMRRSPPHALKNAGEGAAPSS